VRKYEQSEDLPPLPSTTNMAPFGGHLYLVCYDMSMSTNQEPMNPNSENPTDLVGPVLAANFELAEGHLSREQVASRLVEDIEAFPKDDLAVVAIIGGPASGKSTLTQLLIDSLNEHGLKADSISTDDYGLGTREWRWEREREDPLKLKDFALLNMHIEAIRELGEGEQVAVPVYDQPTGLAIEVGEENFPHKIGKLNVLFVEGDFDAVDEPNMRIFIDVPAETRMQVRIARDLKDRGELDADKVATSFKSRHEKQYIPHTAPAIHHSDLVLKVDASDPKSWQYDVYRAKGAES
jgi:uridine kinase